MGLSTSKTKSSSTSKGTATTTPQVPGYIQGPVSDYFGRVGNLASQTPGANAFAPSQLQQQAFSGAGSLGAGRANITQGADATRGLLDFTPDSVQAGQLSSTDLNPYMDPFQSNVIDSLLGDFSHANDLGINSLRAIGQGVHGGSRQAVAAGQLVGDNTRNLTGQIANLRSQGFQNAQQAALQDINNRLGADQFNSQQGLAGANFRLGAAGQLGNTGIAQDANDRANLGLMGDLGAQQQQANAMSDPAMQQAAWLQQLQQLLGLNPAALIGQQVNSTGSQQGTQSTSDPMGAIGTILNAAATAYASDRRLKKDIVPRGDTINGTPLYEFSYIWDEPGVRHVGVMAQEAPPHAVIVMDNGYLAVDYGAL